CYYLEDPADPKKVLDCQTLVAAADVSRIRSVQISMLVRSTFPDTKYTEKSQYITPAPLKTELGIISRDDLDASKDLLLPWYNYHRRLLVTSVKMRNMGL
ncbi:MAG: hypothetical protein D3908_05265, partial [Candidatus Electrothrix sp. AUS4]|nr:hypothetical protein [Candidatus Electrothrix sp. AUS4]